MTALMAAASEGHAEIVRDLLNAGSNADTQDDEGRTALMLAVAGIRLGVVRTLLESADIEIRNDAGQTALLIAAATGHQLVTETLIEAGGGAEPF